MPISYDSGTTLLTVAYVAGDAKGDSYSNPYTWDDIYAYAVANSLPITKLSNQFYLCQIRILLSGATTFVVFRNIIVDFAGATNNTNHLAVTCNFKINTTAADFSMFYNSGGTVAPFQTRIDFSAVDLDIRNTVFKNIFVFGASKYVKIRDSILFALSNGLSIASSTTYCYLDNIQGFTGGYTFVFNVTPDQFSNVFIQGTTGSILLGYTSNSITLRNLKTFNNVRDLTIGPLVAGAGGVSNFVDSIVDISKITTISRSWTTNHRVNLKATFNIYTEAGANVKLYDKDGVLILNQNADENGEFSDEITYWSRYVEWLEGSGIVIDTTTVSQPFSAVISKVGSETEMVSGISIEQGVPVEIRCNLKPAIEAIVTNRGLAIKANKTNYGNDRDFAIII